MTAQKTEKLMKEILKEEMVEVGIFITLLSYNFIKQTGLPEKEFLKSLKRSLKICKKEKY